jgi:hypothetical protein
MATKGMQGKERNDESKEDAKKKKKLMFPKTTKVLKDTAEGTAKMSKAMGKSEKYNADRVLTGKAPRQGVKRVGAKKSKSKRFGSKF